MDLRPEARSDFQLRLEALRRLLREGEANTQEDLCKALFEKKFDVTQSTISRDLRRIGAIKATDSEGQTVYRLPDEHYGLPSIVSHNLGGLLIDIQSNESMIVLHTSPGSASLVARQLDNLRSSIGILGTIAGDDTIFIAPISTRKMGAIIKKIREEL
jgi:transcriptional regulator of arginine metabolism